MDGWMDRWIGRWMGEWMDGWVGAEWLERCVNNLARLLDVSELIKTSGKTSLLLPSKKPFSEQSNACCLEDLLVSPSP